MSEAPSGSAPRGPRLLAPGGACQPLRHRRIPCRCRWPLPPPAGRPRGGARRRRRHRRCRCRSRRRCSRHWRSRFPSPRYVLRCRGPQREPPRRRRRTHTRGRHARPAGQGGAQQAQGRGRRVGVPRSSSRRSARRRTRRRLRPRTPSPAAASESGLRRRRAPRARRLQGAGAAGFRAARAERPQRAPSPPRTPCVLWPPTCAGAAAGAHGVSGGSSGSGAPRRHCPARAGAPPARQRVPIGPHDRPQQRAPADTPPGGRTAAGCPSIWRVLGNERVGRRFRGRLWRSIGRPAA
jgi:hypothetical protein